MIGPIQNIITNPNLFSATQSVATQVSVETCLKAVGRPAFILMDNQIDTQTKKFSSTKEFLYQLICLGIYLGAVIPVFKKGAYSIAKKMYPDEAIFKAFKTSDDAMKFIKTKSEKRPEIVTELNKTLKEGENPYKLEDMNTNLANGIIQGSSILGSVTGLAIVAPIVSHPMIHPILKAVGLTKHDETKKENLDKQA
ncbi:MAG: hypothetical protein E7Z87_05300 [Cyanobacteria bacterium SIG26]|nr:hypothetical protein [Cyanobacteria bacterium SIG26]